jgi:hypothetical protein
MANEYNRTSETVDAPYEGPQFVHDCSNCRFLGRFGPVDLYHCMQGGRMPTVIARYGHGGHQYISGMEGAEVDPDLAEAKRRAAEKGLQLRPI